MPQFCLTSVTETAIRISLEPQQNNLDARNHWKDAASFWLVRLHVPQIITIGGVAYRPDYCVQSAPPCAREKVFTLIDASGLIVTCSQCIPFMDRSANQKEIDQY